MAFEPEHRESVAYFSMGKLLASGILFSLVLLVRLIFVDSLAWIPWWPAVLGGALAVSIVPWFPTDEPYFSREGLRQKLIFSSLLAAIPLTLKLIDGLLGLGGISGFSWFPDVVQFCLLAFGLGRIPGGGGHAGNGGGNGG